MMMMDDEFFRHIEYVLKYRVHRTQEIKDIALVWYSKTLQNRKALVITLPTCDRYYEITYNGDKDEMYVDTYEKHANQVLTGSELREARQAIFGAVEDIKSLEGMTAQIDELRAAIARKRAKLDEKKKDRE